MHATHQRGEKSPRERTGSEGRGWNDNRRKDNYYFSLPNADWEQ